MTKKQFKIASILFFFLSVLLIIIMLIDTVNTYHNYLKHPEWSAPFTTFLLAKFVYYGIPVIMGLVLSFVFNKKAKK